MEIKQFSNNLNKNYNAVNFKQNNAEVLAEMSTKIMKDINDTTNLEQSVKGKAPKYLEVLSKPLRKVAPWIEEKILKSGKQDAIENLINFGNCMKELVCMIVYPLQVLTNPDIPKDKRRFVGMYDFFVTCFSLGGTLLFMWKGKKITKNFATKLMKGFTKDPVAYPKAQRAVEGGSFVLGIAIQTIFFKRILAPALSPVLAGKVRKRMEDADAKKEKALKDKNSQTQKDSDVLIPPQNDAALSLVSEKDMNSNKLFDAKEFKFVK